MQKKDRKRRLIDIPPIEMIAAGNIVKFVAVNTVAIDSEQMDEQFDRCRDQEDENLRPQDPRVAGQEIPFEHRPRTRLRISGTAAFHDRTMISPAPDRSQEPAKQPEPGLFPDDRPAIRGLPVPRA